MPSLVASVIGPGSLIKRGRGKSASSGGLINVENVSWEQISESLQDNKELKFDTPFSRSTRSMIPFLTSSIIVSPKDVPFSFYQHLFALSYSFYYYFPWDKISISIFALIHNLTLIYHFIPAQEWYWANHLITISNIFWECVKLWHH